MDNNQLPNATSLVGLVQFLRGRVKDTVSKAQISQEAFLRMAKNLGIAVSADNLAELIDQPPLNSILEPLDPSSGIITFKHTEKPTTTSHKHKSKDIVSKMAKKANRLK